jgi:hypothetical protein
VDAPKKVNNRQIKTIAEKEKEEGERKEQRKREISK